MIDGKTEMEILKRKEKRGESKFIVDVLRRWTAASIDVGALCKRGVLCKLIPSKVGQP